MRRPPTLCTYTTASTACITLGTALVGARSLNGNNLTNSGNDMTNWGTDMSGLLKLAEALPHSQLTSLT